MFPVRPVYRAILPVPWRDPDLGEAVQLVLGGKGILILARRREPEVDVRTGLLHALDLFTALPEAGGRA